MNIRDNRGPSTDPRGTPHAIPSIPVISCAQSMIPESDPDPLLEPWHFQCFKMGLVKLWILFPIFYSFPMQTNSRRFKEGESKQM